VGWAGLTYLNVVWQNDMVRGMLRALLGSFVIVFIMMLVLFRSVWFALLAMLPLSVTIGFIYGLIGLVGKDYDMPVAAQCAHAGPFCGFRDPLSATRARDSGGDP
jgi:predicted RND superfamily exporter protein